VTKDENRVRQGNRLGLLKKLTNPATAKKNPATAKKKWSMV
jgi:hypothetical protein